MDAAAEFGPPSARGVGRGWPDVRLPGRAVAQVVGPGGAGVDDFEVHEAGGGVQPGVDCGDVFEPVVGWQGADDLGDRAGGGDAPFDGVEAFGVASRYVGDQLGRERS